MTNQSVEAAPEMAGIRWWEIRNPGANALLYQDSTFAPGVTDGIHRWMGSIAQDSSGNMGLGYSASSTTVFPSVYYTGRLESDPLNEMTQGEGIFVTANGGHTAATRRWGDYTSMNIDSTDDCTFWYINEYFPTSGTQWTLRVGSFKFPTCGQPNLGVAAVPLSRGICTPTDATFTVDAHGYNGFTSSTLLSVTGAPPGTTATFSPPAINPVPGSSTLTIGNTGVAIAGRYTLNVTGTSAVPALVRSRPVVLDVFTTTPGPATLSSPTAGATGVGYGPLLSWTAASQASTYVVEVANNAGFSPILYTSAPTTATSQRMPNLLAAGTSYFWRVRATNTCGGGGNSATSTFTTRFAPGVCGAGEALTTGFSDNMENGINGWTTSTGVVGGPTWAQSTARPSSGATSWLAVDVITTSDQRLVSPPITIPSGQTAMNLRFRQDVSMEANGATACYDGGFVEVSTNDGSTWAPLPASAQLEDFYDGPLGTGESAWCGVQPYTTASFDVDSFAGQQVRFRFRARTDSSVGSVPHGWYVDDVRIEGCNDIGLLFTNGFE